MKNFIYILILKSQISNLKRLKDNKILDIITHQKSVANRVDKIEDVAPTFFKDIDKKIALRKRMIRIIKMN